MEFSYLIYQLIVSSVVINSVMIQILTNVCPEILVNDDICDLVQATQQQSMQLVTGSTLPFSISTIVAFLSDLQCSSSEKLNLP